MQKPPAVASPFMQRGSDLATQSSQGTAKPSATTRRQKVAILGGGPGGLAAAYGLSNTPALRERFEVTVYQLGWRCGGKITSGRQGPEHRMQQNGTHYLFGCYDNSFALIKAAYDQLNGSGEHRFGSYEEAFIPVGFLALKQHFQGEWHNWCIEMPTNGHVPGDHAAAPEPREIVSMLMQWMVETIGGWQLSKRIQPSPPFSAGFTRPGWWGRLAGRLFDTTVHDMMKLAAQFARMTGAGEDLAAATIWILNAVRNGIREQLGNRVETDLQACRQWMLTDLGCSMLTGLLKDRALEPGGMGALDKYDYRDWLRRHGATDMTLASPLVQGWYDSIASFEDGDVHRPNVSAGATLYALLYAGMGYKGSFAYQPSRELGDAWVAPMCRALEQRGVTFRYFQRVWDLEADEGEVCRIRMEDQLPGHRTDDYDPFIMVRGRKAWPDHPLWERLPDTGSGPAGEPDPRSVDLEDFYTPWRGRDYHLEKGRDFDVVVYALPIGTVPYYCRQLLAEQKSWRDMAEHVRSVDTRSLWLYFRPTLKELGWPYPRPVLTGYAQPFSTWEETTYLVDCETWPPGEEPGTINSLFGTVPGPTFAPPPDEPGDYPRRQQQATQDSAYRFATEFVRDLWPRATLPDDPNTLDWSLLIDLENRTGIDRMAFQGLHANYGPVQRFTTALAGTLHYRLRPDETGYANLYLAGDWVRNGTEVGCVEGAVKGGLLAAIAVSGEGTMIGGDSKSGLL
ncbi:MAG: NAD(P)-binding protein [Pseudomonadales bacterium]